MKKIIAILLVVLTMFPMSGLAFKGMTMIPAKEDRNIGFHASYPDNPVIPGESATTGLPFSGTYVPIMQTIDNATVARPNLGISQADILYLMPNVGGGSTRVVALYADNSPEESGGSRSFRPIFDQVCQEWGAALAYASGSDKALQILKSGATWKNKLAFDINNSMKYSKRISTKHSPHNLIVNIAQIKEALIAKGKTFTPHPFLFTDALPQNGVPATSIEVYQHSRKAGAGALGDDDSFFAFHYDAAKNAYLAHIVDEKGSKADGYSEKPYLDALNKNMGALPFNNIIVIRTQYRSQAGYFMLKNPVGTGYADIFTGGKYIAGGWSRAALDQRTVFVDQNGDEIALQRGKTFVIIIESATGDVYYK